MTEAEANDIADKIAIRMVGIVADMIAGDKRLAESIAAIIYEKIGDKLVILVLRISHRKDVYR